MKREGVVLIFTLAILVGMLGFALAILSLLGGEMKSINAGFRNMQAFYVAEAGRAKARYALTTGGQTAGYGESGISVGAGQYTFTTAYSDPPTNQHVTITSDGYVPNSTNPLARRTVVESDILYSLGSGPNLSLETSGTVATSSPYQGQNDPGEAIDGSLITGWVSNVFATSWLKLDYGSNKSVSKVVVNGSKITSIVVQYSTDNVNFSPVPNPSGALPGTRTFDTVTARYLRLDITSGAKQKAQVNEYESYASATGVMTLGRGSFVTSR